MHVSMIDLFAGDGSLRIALGEAGSGSIKRASCLEEIRKRGSDAKDDLKQVRAPCNVRHVGRGSLTTLRRGML